MIGFGFGCLFFVSATFFLDVVHIVVFTVVLNVSLGTAIVTVNDFRCCL